MIKEAFFKVCEGAKSAEDHFVSLYYRSSYYGGPEDGGWWGHDTSLVAYQAFKTEELALAAAEKVKELAASLTEEERRQFGQQCLREMEWLEARGLDADFLPEVDGNGEYFVVVEEYPGRSESSGPQHYD